jgi:hypothetical protein
MTGTSFTTWGLIVAEKVGSRKKESEARMARKLGRDSDGGFSKYARRRPDRVE